MSNDTNAILFERWRKEALAGCWPALRWELRLNRETFDLEVGVVNDTGDVVPRFTWRITPVVDHAELDRFCAAWDQTCGNPAGSS
jgi:hypothetical protein